MNMYVNVENACISKGVLARNTQSRAKYSIQRQVHVIHAHYPVKLNQLF